MESFLVGRWYNF